MSRIPDTIAALATPAGVAALAVIRVSGPACRALAESLAGRSLPERRPCLVRYADRRGQELDDVLLTLFPAPRSYTGEDLVELSSHGSPFIVGRILEDLSERGCRPAGPGEFTQRAFLNGRLDLAQAEAVMDVIGARSESALAAARRQLHGALGRHVAGLIGGLVDCLARLEATIDFPEEDLPEEDRTQVTGAVAEVLRGTERLLATGRTGERMRRGIRTVLLGEPNAGKSSLLNGLVGRDRALVSPEPGTTRDYIEEFIPLGRHGFLLVDTAGLNPEPGTLERLGIEKTLERVADADLFLWVLDSTRPLPALPDSFLPKEVAGQGGRTEGAAAGAGGVPGPARDLPGTAGRSVLRAENTVIVLNKSDLVINHRPDPTREDAVADGTGDNPRASWQSGDCAPTTPPCPGSPCSPEPSGSSGHPLDSEGGHLNSEVFYWHGFACISVSALTGRGLEALQAALCGLADRIQVTVGDDLISINHRHAHALAEARACLESALRSLEAHGLGELIASDLRGALDCLGEIGGRVDNEQILDKLFASFCIGK